MQCQCIVVALLALPFICAAPSVLLHRNIIQDLHTIDNQDVARTAPKPHNFPKSFDRMSPSQAQEVMRMSQTSGKEDVSSSSVSGLECDSCIVLVGLIQFYMDLNSSKEDVGKEIEKACITLKIEDKRVCHGIINMFQEEVLTVVDRLVLSPREVCGLLLGDGCETPYDPLAQWNVSLPDKPKPPPRPPQQPSSSRLRVLQLSDIHIDLDYLVGASSACGEPLCCRRGDNITDGPEGGGRWGDYRNCDTPLWTLQLLLQHLQKNEKFDYILWTGDLPAHNVWDQPRAAQAALLANLTALLTHYFPGTPVYATLGNHESSPVNNFPPRWVTGPDSVSWLYEALADSWAHWLPATSLPSVRRGGYYTILLKPGFRLVSLNTNACNDQNYWLYVNNTDPDGQLAWLVDTLQAAEDQGEKVHIIGHIPPGDSCLRSWSWAYYTIINRYESTVHAQFFGHTHTDRIEIFYDPVTGFKRPVAVGYLGPSVTPFSFLNPAYRVYTLDGWASNSTWDVLDHETHILNLTAANAAPDTPKWQKLYSAKESYGLAGLSAVDWDDFLQRMTANRTLFDLYNYHMYHGAPQPACDDACRYNRLCDVRSARSHDPDLCRPLGPPAAPRRREDLC